MLAPADSAADIRSAISAETWDLAAFTGELTEVTATTPFGDEAVAFCSALSGELLGASSGIGQAQLVSLGYWLRPASVARMRESFQRAAAPGLLLVPRGRVFHVTPANVDTMFAYSWLLALLTGNVNVVRISNRETELGARVLEAVAAVLDRPAFATRGISPPTTSRPLARRDRKTHV